MNPEARLSVVAYRPKPGKEMELLALTLQHVPYLRSHGLATDRAPIIAKAADGTVLEVFEWAEGGIDKAHGHPAIKQLWARYASLCDYIPLSALEEAQTLFAGFVPVSQSGDEEGGAP